MSQITLAEQSTPSTPSSGTAVIYPKSNGFWYSLNAAGNEIILGGIQQQTPVATTSGTSITIASGIISSASVVEIALSGISTNGTSAILIQLGDSGGFENTGYVSTAWQGGSGDTFSTSTAGFLCNSASSAALSISGVVLLRRGTGNLWTFGGTTARSDGAGYCLGGTKTLSDTLTQIRMTVVNGTDTFDAGEVTPFY